MILLVFALFAWAVAATALAGHLLFKVGLVKSASVVELDSYKRVGQWYENRVAELELETRQLAAQIIDGGSLVRPTAMPLPDDDMVGEWAYDSTGLVRERLDPRDLPIT